MRDQTKPTSVDPFKLGDRIKIKGFDKLLGRILEFRGPLGPGGAFIYGIEIQNGSGDPYIELREDQIEHAPAPARARRPKAPKVSAEKPKASKRATSR
jgi:hypothetical protein